MTDMKTVSLEEADFPSLKHHAEVIMGLEVKTGTNASQLRAKIQRADNTLTEIAVFVPEGQDEQPGDVVEIGPARSTTEANAGKAAAVTRDHADPLHSSNDPKVTLTVNKTSDKTRAKICDICVNGVVFRIQRGHKVDVPYRVYEALENAKEKAAIETDEINPQTGEPFKEWEDVYSYPFQVHKMPSDEEIAKWRAATDAVFQKAA